MSTTNRINVEAILDDLYASEINVEISWLWDGGIDVKVGRLNVKLGDPLNGYDTKGKVKSMAEAAVWLRDQACQHADLRGAYLCLTQLDGADLSDANLEDVEGLTQDQLDRAPGNSGAKLPVGLTGVEDGKR